MGQLSPEEAAQLDASRSAFDSATPPPVKPKTYLAAGRLAESRGDLDQAARQYERVLQLDPNDPEALFRLGLVRSRQAHEAAPEVWRKYLAVTDDAGVGYANLGFSYELLGRLPEAEAAYRDGIDADPSDESCRINYGLFLARNDRLDAAEAQLTRVLPPAKAWYNIGSTLERQGDLGGARAAFEKASQLDPDFAPARDRLAALKAPPEPTGVDAN